VTSFIDRVLGLWEVCGALEWSDLLSHVNCISSLAAGQVVDHDPSEEYEGKAMFKSLAVAFLAIQLMGFVEFCASEDLNESPSQQATASSGRGPALPARNDGLTSFDQWLDGVAAKDLAVRRERLALIHTRADAEVRRAEVRTKILSLIGGLPARTSLNARSTGETRTDGFVIRKVLFDSQPSFPVTALLYVPTRTEERHARPAILISPGHYPAGKAGDARMAALFARNGFVVLSYDPIGLGERLQYGDPANPKTSLAGPPTSEHAEASLQPELIGDTFSRYMLWDAMRGIDYLSSLSEVDSKRIGAFGCSGGGTITAMLGALDARVAAVGVACYITSFDALLPTLGPQDAEQSIPRFISSGLDFPDWIEAAAPRPYAVISTYSDMFPFEGARSSVIEARRFYALFDPESEGSKTALADASEPEMPTGPALNSDTSSRISPAAKLQFITGPGKHGSLWPIAANILSFFIRNLEPEAEADHLFLPKDLADNNPGIEGTLHGLPNGALQVTETGQVSTGIPDARTVMTLNKERSVALLAHAHTPSGAELRVAIRKETGATVLPGASHYNLSAAKAPSGKLILPMGKTTSVEGELILPGGVGKHPGVLFMVPDRLQGESAADRALESQRNALVAQGKVVLAIPPLPSISEIGSSKPTTLGPMYLPSLRAELVGLTLMGTRIDEVLTAVDYLASRPDVDPSRISAIGSGHMGIVLLHAAVLDSRIARVFIKDTVVRYRSLLDVPMPRGATEDIVPGVLLRYDLPALRKALGKRLIESTEWAGTSERELPPKE